VQPSGLPGAATEPPGAAMSRQVRPSGATGAARSRLERPSGPPGCGHQGPPGAAIRSRGVRPSGPARCGYGPQGAAIRTAVVRPSRPPGVRPKGRQVRPSDDRRVRPGGVDEAVRPGSRPPSTRRPHLRWQWPRAVAAIRAAGCGHQGRQGAAIRATVELVGQVGDSQQKSHSSYQ
jgi:hypothetical protein